MRPRLGRLVTALLLVAVSRASAIVMLASTKFLVDDVLVRRDLGFLRFLVPAVVGAVVVQTATNFAATLILSSQGIELVAQLRRTLQQHVSKAPLRFFDATHSGTLVRRIMEDAGATRVLVGSHLVEFAGGLLTAAFAVAFLWHVSPFLTMASIVAALAMAWVSRRAFGIFESLFRDTLRINAEVSGRLLDSIAGARVVKAHRGEAYEARVFAAGAERIAQASLRFVQKHARVSAFVGLLTGLGTAGLTLLGAREVLAGHLTIGGLISFLASLTFLVAPVRNMVSLGSTMAEGLAGLARANELLREPTEDDAPKRTQRVTSVRGHVALDNVSFSYDGTREVLSRVSFEAHPGMVTALAGPSGAGKTTIIGLLAAFHEPSSGTVRVDGIDLSTVTLHSYRTHLGLVLQDVFLFPGSISENVAFPHEDARETEVRRACRLAHVDEFAERLPRGYETLVGERGISLSTGQRQRIAIARAILADPRILLLDEATSSLDAESEAAVQDGLAYLMRGRTTFIVAHRLSTIRRADQILLMDRGRLVERGTHESLWATRGRYYELVMCQAEFAGPVRHAPAIAIPE
jgi:ABC-type multidrug transport system fused ATPase/permease subunit